MGSKGDVNRRRIVSAADDLFYRRGFEHTSFTDIADAASIPRGNFYYYFKTKDDILSAVIQQRSQDIKNMLAQWDEEFSSPHDRLKREVKMIVNSQEKIKEHGCPLGSLCLELSKLQHMQQYSANEMFEIFRDWNARQFSLLGYEQEANQLALHLLARIQGIATILNAYEDQAFLEHEVALLDDWIDQHHRQVSSTA